MDGHEFMTESPVLSSLDDAGVFLVTLNRPQKKNAFNRAQWEALRDALEEARKNDDVTVVVLTGAGDNFSAGVDLTDFGHSEEEPKVFNLFFDALLALDKPLLAAVQGVAVGIGATVLFHCDIVYVGESVRMSLPFARRSGHGSRVQLPDAGLPGAAAGGRTPVYRRMAECPPRP